MKKFLLLLVLFGFSVMVQADPRRPRPLPPPARSVSSQVYTPQPPPLLNAPEIEQYTEINVDEIVLRNVLELEQAAMEYVLSYEAYIEARKSKNPDIKVRIVELMKDYRKSYANFLALLREDKLYHPQKPKNPAGWYNKKHEKTHGHKRDWKKTDAKEIRKKVKEKVKNGASPEEIRQFIKANLPTQAMSSTPTMPCSTSTNPCPR